MRAQHMRVTSPSGDLQVAIYARVSSDQQAERLCQLVERGRKKLHMSSFRLRLRPHCTTPRMPQLGRAGAYERRQGDEER